MPSGLGWRTRQEHSESAGRKGCLGEHLISGPDNKGNGRRRGFYKMSNPGTTYKDPQIWAIPSQQHSQLASTEFFTSLSPSPPMLCLPHRTISPTPRVQFHLVRDRLSVVSPLLPGNSTFRIAGLPDSRSNSTAGFTGF